MRNGANSFLGRVSATVLAFFMNVVLARVAGAEHYGGFVYLMAWLNVLLIPACLGFDRLLVRVTAAEHSRGDLYQVRAWLRKARGLVLKFAVALALAAGAALYLVRESQPAQLVLAGYFVIALIPIMAIVRLQQGGLQGLHAIAWSLTPEFIVVPVLIIFGTVLASRVLAGAPPTWIIVAINLCAGLVALGLGWFMLVRLLPRDSAEILLGEQVRIGIASALPLMMVGGILMLSEQVTPLLLGFLGGSRDVALYAAAEKWSGFTILMMQVINVALAPIMAGLYARNEMRELQILYTRGAQLAMFLWVPAAAALIFAPGPFLSAFGAGFSGASAALAILVLGQLVNAVTGGVGSLLIMTGHERSVAHSAGIGLGVCVVLGLVVIPLWGAAGGAAATSAGIIVTNVLLSMTVWSRLRIYPTGLGLLLAGRESPRAGVR